MSSLEDDDLDFNSICSQSFSPCPNQQPASDDFHVPKPQVQASSPLKRPEKLLKGCASNPLCQILHSSSSSQIISFGKTSSSSFASWLDDKNVLLHNEKRTKNDYSYLTSEGEKSCYGIPAPRYSQFYDARGAYYNKSSSRTPLHGQEHVIAERKRRESLNQRLVALSAIIPGLRKMDKASVLEDATNYLKQLQERVKTLEEEVSKKTGKVVFKKSWLLPDEETSPSSDENSCHQSNNNLPAIEARISDKFILLKFQCLNRKGCVSKILQEVEKLNLCVLNTSVLPFGSCILDVTILAQINEEFKMEFKNFVKTLCRALLGII